MVNWSGNTQNSPNLFDAWIQNLYVCHFPFTGTVYNKLLLSVWTKKLLILDSFPMVAYLCHHLSDNYVELSDFYVVLSDLYFDLSDNYIDLSPIHLLENKSLKRVLAQLITETYTCLLYTSPSPRDRSTSRMPSCRIFMSSCQIFILTCKIFILTCNLFIC